VACSRVVDHVLGKLYPERAVTIRYTSRALEEIDVEGGPTEIAYSGFDT
jgi:hypothetical protein